MMVNTRINPASVVLLLVYAMPYFMVFVIPMSAMMGVLIGFLRLSNDNEIIALKSGGVSLYRLLPPVIAFTCIGCLLTAWMSMVAMPWGKTSFKRLAYDLATANIQVGLRERTFIDDFSNVMLYANKVDLNNNALYDVFIEDQSHQKIVGTIVSPRGELFSDPDHVTFHLRLHDGLINEVNMDQKTSNSIRFETYELTLDLKNAIDTAKSKGNKDEKEMSQRELMHYLRNRPVKDTHYYKALIELHNRYSIPVACLVLGVLAIPLGIQSKATRKSYGLGLGLIFFLLYYLLLTLGSVLGKSGIYPPLIGSWVPNVVMGCMGIFLLRRAEKEAPIGIQALTERVGQAFIKRFCSAKN